jgi:D-alanyl-D-alanine carboxypeptidase (penicillin-binding protein 5/6)
MKDSQLLKKKQKKFIQNKLLKASNKPREKKISQFSNIRSRWLSVISKEKLPITSAKVPQQKVTGNKIESFIKRHEVDFQMILIPLILYLIFIIISFVNDDISRTTSQNKLSPVNFMVKVNDYPFVQSVQLPTISAKAGIIIDSDSQVVLFSKNPKLRFSMASTTKIMSALVAFDYYQDGSILTVRRFGVEGSVLGLLLGEKYSFKDLLYAMLLPSANDAAYTIADNYPGGEDAFVLKMNEKAAMLHLSDTHFSDPTGLDDDGDYTTVVDMARLASYAIKNKEFTEITSTKKKIITTTSFTKQYELNNLNRLLGKEGVYGIKTGTTEGAGEVLVTSTMYDGHTFIIVVMNSQQRFVDTEILLSFIAKNVKYKSTEINPAGLLLK